MLSYKRSQRVGELVQQEISRIVQEMNALDGGLITITGIKMTDDLQEARVFYSVLGSPEEIAKGTASLKQSIQEIRHQLAVRLNLRRTPSLYFVFDETVERAVRIVSILEKIKDEAPADTTGSTVDQDTLPDVPEEKKPRSKKQS